MYTPKDLKNIKRVTITLREKLEESCMPPKERKFILQLKFNKSLSESENHALYFQSTFHIFRIQKKTDNVRKQNRAVLFLAFFTPNVTFRQ